MGSVLVFGPIGGVAKCLVATGDGTLVRFLPRVTPNMGLEVFQSGIRLATPNHCTLVWPLEKNRKKYIMI